MDHLHFSRMMSDDTEFIPLITNEEENNLPLAEIPDIISILPLRNTVIFPGVVSPITAGRDKSIRLIQDAKKGSKIFGVMAQKNSDTQDPEWEDVHAVGTLVQMVRMFRMPDGNVTAILQGKRRFRIVETITEKPYLQAKIELIEDVKYDKKDKEFKALLSAIKDMALQIIHESPNIPSEAQLAIKNIESDTILLHFIASNMVSLEVKDKQALLEENDLKVRAHSIYTHLSQEQQMLEVKNEIANKVRMDFDQQQREYFLHQQMKTIQEELGGVSHEAEIETLRERGRVKLWSAETAVHFEKEVARLQRMNPQVPDFSIQRGYLEFMLDLPWEKTASKKIDLKKAKRILDRDHFGLEKVKVRILEHLAVLKLKDDMKSPILCLYGPPGVGKTSLGRSVAEALGRPYVRMSLGGMRDESEIRGHRKTYIGAMPGRILQSIKKAGASNPVFVLDEMDKLSYGVQGDPSSALLEVMDPAQNNSFHDNFLEIGYDLSKVLFIATANSLSSIQPALRDRMEIIEVNGYTLEEKVEIGQKHLLPKQIEEHGLPPKSIQLGKSEMAFVIDRYTRESGVRGLDKKLAALVRKAAMAKAMGELYPEAPTLEMIEKDLGTPRFDRDKAIENEVAGVATGLAWTPVGGDILFIETTLSPGTGKLTLTGNLGDVMKESATLALTYLKSQSQLLGLNPAWFSKNDVHIHVPEGATPKDGPSAGIALLTALMSLYTQRKVRNKIALSGEITLRGTLLPVGGIQEKLLAAKRSGIKTVVLCIDNKKDVDEIPARYVKGMEILYFSTLREVLDFAVLSQKVKNFKTLAEV